MQEKPTPLQPKVVKDNSMIIYIIGAIPMMGISVFLSVYFHKLMIQYFADCSCP